jgi:hypothetical protein
MAGRTLGAFFALLTPLGHVIGALVDALRRGKAQLRSDLRADPYLSYILLGATLLASFWIWHRLPNFATRDERWRVLDPIQPVGHFLQDPSFDSIRDGVTYWRSYGGTFYLYGLVLLPVLAFLLLAGESSAVVEMATYSIDDLRDDWLAVPGWVWMAVVLPARLVNVLFAVGSVYVVYRIGTRVLDRATGRLGAVLTSLTWGLLVLAHEAGEDVPALFFFLLAVFLAIEYVESGARRTFFLGCLCGGLAAGFKLNAGTAALVLGAAHLTRARRADAPVWRAFLQPRLLLGGMAIGVVAILASYPQVLVGAPVEVSERVGRGIESKGEIHSWLTAPGWWWTLRGLLHGLGLPLALASVGGFVGALGWVHESSRVGDLARFSVVVFGTVLLVYSQWQYVRTHHLLVTFPLLVLLVAIGARRFADHRPRVARVLVAALVISTAAYAVAGDLGYAAQGRDHAARFLADDAAPDDTVEVYTRDPQDIGVPHGIDLSRPPVPEGMTNVTDRCPDYVVLGQHRALLYTAPESHSARSDVFDHGGAGETVDALLAGEVTGYEVAARFGRQPRYRTDRPPRPAWWELLRVGVQPRTIQYGDPQDLGVYQYTVVVERTGPCGDGTDGATSLAG